MKSLCKLILKIKNRNTTFENFGFIKINIILK